MLIFKIYLKFVRNYLNFYHSGSKGTPFLLQFCHSLVDLCMATSGSISQNSLSQFNGVLNFSKALFFAQNETLELDECFFLQILLKINLKICT
jgi:hypothetical protein